MAIKYYRNPDTTDFLIGVPSTDITDEAYVAMEAEPQRALDTYIANGGQGWAPTAYATDVPPKPGDESPAPVLHPALVVGGPPSSTEDAPSDGKSSSEASTVSGDTTSTGDSESTASTTLELPPTGKNKVGKVGEQTNG